jgi:hypothetical protein
VRFVESSSDGSGGAAAASSWQRPSALSVQLQSEMHATAGYDHQHEEPPEDYSDSDYSGDDAGEQLPISKSSPVTRTTPKGLRALYAPHNDGWGAAAVAAPREASAIKRSPSPRGELGRPQQRRPAGNEEGEEADDEEDGKVEQWIRSAKHEAPRHGDLLERVRSDAKRREADLAASAAEVAAADARPREREARRARERERERARRPAAARRGGFLCCFVGAGEFSDCGGDSAQSGDEKETPQRQSAGQASSGAGALALLGKKPGSPHGADAGRDSGADCSGGFIKAGVYSNKSDAAEHERRRAAGSPKPLRPSSAARRRSSASESHQPGAFQFPAASPTPAAAPSPDHWAAASGPAEEGSTPRLSGFGSVVSGAGRRSGSALSSSTRRATEHEHASRSGSPRRAAEQEHHASRSSSSRQLDLELEAEERWAREQQMAMEEEEARQQRRRWKEGDEDDEDEDEEEYDSEGGRYRKHRSGSRQAYDNSAYSPEHFADEDEVAPAVRFENSEEEADYYAAQEESYLVTNCKAPSHHTSTLVASPFESEEERLQHELMLLEQQQMAVRRSSGAGRRPALHQRSWEAAAARTTVSPSISRQGSLGRTSVAPPARSTRLERERMEEEQRQHSPVPPAIRLVERQPSIGSQHTTYTAELEPTQPAGSARSTPARTASPGRERAGSRAASPGRAGAPSAATMARQVDALMAAAVSNRAAHRVAVRVRANSSGGGAAAAASAALGRAEDGGGRPQLSGANNGLGMAGRDVVEAAATKYRVSAEAVQEGLLSRRGSEPPSGALARRVDAARAARLAAIKRKQRRRAAERRRAGKPGVAITARRKLGARQGTMKHGGGKGSPLTAATSVLAARTRRLGPGLLGAPLPRTADAISLCRTRSKRGLTARGLAVRAGLLMLLCRVPTLHQALASCGIRPVRRQLGRLPSPKRRSGRLQRRTDDPRLLRNFTVTGEHGAEAADEETAGTAGLIVLHAESAFAVGARATAARKPAVAAAIPAPAAAAPAAASRAAVAAPRSASPGPAARLAAMQPVARGATATATATLQRPTASFHTTARPSSPRPSSPGRARPSTSAAAPAAAPARPPVVPSVYKNIIESGSRFHTLGRTRSQGMDGLDSSVFQEQQEEDSSDVGSRLEVSRLVG